MKDLEVYSRFHNMIGTGEDRIERLAEIYDCKEKDIKAALQRCQGITPETLKEINVYNPDTNPFCKIRVMVPEESKIASTAVYKRLDELDKEIKALDEKKKLLEIEYKALVDHMGGTINE